MKDQEYMKVALDLALKGIGFVAPNPMVGCVIVKDERIISEGYHREYGLYHAEREAIISCIESVEGATVYVTLEPCCHYGKTPPCTEILIEKGIKRVVVGCLDPNPKVAGKGVQLLRDSGIEVIVGVLEKECRELNKVFIHYVKTNIPYVAVKFAMSMDGKIATSIGESKWITSEKSRVHGYTLRHKYSAILVGIETVIKDNPMLDAKNDSLENPVRVICDSRLRVPLESNIVKTARDIRTIIATTSRNEELIHQLKNKGCEVIIVDSDIGNVDLSKLMLELAKRSIDSILVEGGGTIQDSFFRKDLVNYIHAYIAPIVIGGINAKSVVSGKGFMSLDSVPRFTVRNVNQIDEDIYIEGEF